MAITFNTEDQYLCAYLLAKYYDYEYGESDAPDGLIQDIDCGRIREIVSLAFDNDKDKDFIDVYNCSIKILKDKIGRP